MRVYVPLLLRELTGAGESGMLPRRAAFGVTCPLRATGPTADEEDLEFEAMCAALDEARGLGPGRRVVVAAETSKGNSAGGADGRLGEELAVDLDDVVAFHVEEGEGPAGGGYDDLLWFDVTELGELTD